jgi:hypothetical protein
MKHSILSYYEKSNISLLIYLSKEEQATLWVNGNISYPTVVNREGYNTISFAKSGHYTAVVKDGFFAYRVAFGSASNGNSYPSYLPGLSTYPLKNDLGELSEEISVEDMDLLMNSLIAEETPVIEEDEPQLLVEDEPQAMKLEPEKVDGTVANPNTSTKSVFKALNISTATPIIASRNTAYTGVRFVFSQEPGNQVKDKVHEHSWTASSNLSDFALGSTQAEYHKASLVATRVPVIMFFSSYQTEVSCLTCGKSPISLQAKGYRYFLLTPDDSVLIQETGTEKVPVIYFCSIEEFDNAHPNEAIDYNGVEATNGSATGIPETVSNTISSIGSGASSIASNPLEYRTNGITNTIVSTEPGTSTSISNVSSSNEKTDLNEVLNSVETVVDRSIKSYSQDEVLARLPASYKIVDLKSLDTAYYKDGDVPALLGENQVIEIGSYTIPVGMIEDFVDSMFCNCDEKPMSTFEKYKDLEFPGVVAENTYIEELIKFSEDAESILVDKLMYAAIKSKILSGSTLNELMCSLTGLIMHKNFGTIGVGFDIPLNLLILNDTSYKSKNNSSAIEWSVKLASKGILVMSDHPTGHNSSKDPNGAFFIVKSSRWTLVSNCTVNKSSGSDKLDIKMIGETNILKGPENPYSVNSNDSTSLEFSIVYENPISNPLQVIVTADGARLSI